MNTRPELLAPAGTWDCLRAAVAGGADAVYFGLSRFNARMRAENFPDDDLPRVVAFLHSHGVKAHVTLNVLIFTNELAEAVDELALLNRHGVDAVIIQDVGLAALAARLFPALRVHASTQMTITSPEGVRFAESLGARQVVLGREVSLGEIAKFETDTPLEVFVHGALCVAYSGQCLTSESLGQRSANRGECAQACRMPYEMIVDGRRVDLGEKRYLLSPQDLAAVHEIPELIRLGIRSFKIEGRLKSPEYVAAVTAVYRKAIDAAMDASPNPLSDADQYRLEMTFSRGLFTGWMHGVDHQRLVNATHGKKRGVLIGTVATTGPDWVAIQHSNSKIQNQLRPGDGVVFENLSDTNCEQGGRIYEVRGDRVAFERGRLDTAGIAPGTRIWKTSDPALDRELRKAWQARIKANGRGKSPLTVTFHGTIDGPLKVTASTSALSVTVESDVNLAPARTSSLDELTADEIFSRLHETPFVLESIRWDVAPSTFLPRAELNRLKHDLVERLEASRTALRQPAAITLREALDDLVASASSHCETAPALTVLCRTMDQIDAALDCGVKTVCADFEDIRRYGDAVDRVGDRAAIFLATPRIQKAGEQGFFKLIEAASPHGVLIRNVGAISWFENSPLRLRGDFSLNVANPASAAIFLARGLERVAISCDLDATQVLDLLAAAPPEWFELTIHQHMAMFHMEHCAFAAFLSKGSTFLDCGRPCEKHQVHLRDRVGIEHPLRADVGCRNTLFNATAQSGAAHFNALQRAGLRHFRVELLEEDRDAAKEIVHAYLDLLNGASTGADLRHRLNVRSQLGVTGGTLEQFRKSSPGIDG